MTLYEFMENKADDDTVYCIGAKDAYLFCTKKEDFDQKAKYWEHEIIEGWTETMKRHIYKAAHKLSLTQTHSDNVLVMGYVLQKDIQIHEDERKAGIDNTMRLLNRIAGFTRFGDREVKDVYDRQEKGTKAILIEGTEHGDFWDYKEYTKWEEEQK